MQDEEIAHLTVPEIVELIKLPALPSAAGTYALKVTVTASGKTLSWV